MAELALVEKLTDERGLSFSDFVLTAAKKGVVDALNAQRLLAFRATSDLLEAEVTNRLGELAGDHAGELIPGRIIAPLLRVRDDFKDEETVYAQPGRKGEWQRFPLFGVDQVTDEVLIDELQVEPGPRMITTFEPQAPTIFTPRDYNILRPPVVGRRAQRAGLAARFALGLSVFDTTTQDNSTLAAVHRHFHLAFSIDPFRSEPVKSLRLPGI